MKDDSSDAVASPMTYHFFVRSFPTLSPPSLSAWTLE